MDKGSRPESRYYPRYEVRKLACYKYGGDRFLTVTQDLGMGGMKINASHFLPEGEQLEFELALDQNRIAAKGRVVYSNMQAGNQFFSGIQFIQVSEEEKKLLQVFLNGLPA